jgi:hypothetical protein
MPNPFGTGYDVPRARRLVVAAELCGRPAAPWSRPVRDGSRIGLNKSEPAIRRRMVALSATPAVPKVVTVSASDVPGHARERLGKAERT